MDTKKTSVNLTVDNIKKMNRVMQSEGITQSQFINQAIAGIPIIMLGDRKTVAENFFEIRRLLSQNKEIELKKEVEEACQLLNTLMEKIGANRT